ncbi:hypothetical protein VOLCADRAFT_116013 [Volvox carteri f. nagariensis]|uniref:SHSP domain-containing protein n=1 Tax=Volvox carteri f. nagariensis TaxID=3068 RepID=D8TJG6_VOLCA|nr:uncharacterized protein VOLCADRAFT_116013 [Volvox carteri f. nagariensis]EFJ52538.1 hypothetical protein VOLCADRAFT_116013 [Volvox carteri f. nagariensis]|eukprot:XP_002946611.1 hypothetical protein VOLCADRAFT_116013 [Volvox carteri f. nagariensis]
MQFLALRCGCLMRMPRCKCLDVDASMGPEDIRVDVSPDRILTIAGSRQMTRIRSAAGEAAAATVAEAEAGHSSHDDKQAASEKVPPARKSTRGNGGPCSRVASYRFSRSFVLPDDADVGGVAAALERGVLTITIPRRAMGGPKTRRVKISVSDKGDR